MGSKASIAPESLIVSDPLGTMSEQVQLRSGRLMGVAMVIREAMCAAAAQKQWY